MLVVAALSTPVLAPIQLPQEGKGPFFPGRILESSILDDPDGVALGDLDGDGRLDVVLSVASDTFAALQLPNGLYGALNPLGIGGTLLQEIVIRDFDDDGNADLLGLARFTGEVTTFLGQGDGTFGPPAVEAIGSAPKVARVGDLNGDGALDAVVLHSLTLTLMIGRGDGTFTLAPGPAIVQASVQDFQLADVTGDGELDLVVPHGSNAGVEVLPGQGDGTFAPALTTPGTYGVSATGDLDGDGIGDLVTDGVGFSIEVLLGGPGGLSAPVSYSTPDVNARLRVRDVDGDGNLDVLAAPFGTDRDVGLSLFTGLGDGTFDAYETIPAYLDFLEAEDVDGDGDFDLAGTVFAFTDQGGGFTVLENDGTGAFRPRSIPSGTGPSVPRIADVDADGLADVLTVDGGSDDLTIALGVGGGRFAVADVLPVGVAPSDLALVDVDGSGTLDAVVVENGSQTLSVYTGGGDGSFAALGSSAAGFDPRRIATGDLDLSGTTDFVVADRDGQQVVILLSNGDGTLAASPAVFLGNRVQDVEVGDFDEDGTPDVVAIVDETFGESAILFLPGQGDGTFGSAIGFFGIASDPVASTTADFDGDGRLDLAVLDDPSSDVERVRILLGQGDGTFTGCALPVGPCDIDVQLGGTTSNPTSLASGDLDGDGAPDLVVTLEYKAAFAVLWNTGTGSFVSRSFHASPDDPSHATIGDVDGDGDLDVVVATALHGDVKVYPGRGSELTPTVYCTATASSSGCLAQIAPSDPGAQPTSGAADYSVVASGVQETRNGLLFVSLGGAATIPFGQGTLCMNPPLKRGPILNSGGTHPANCGGAYATLVNDGQVVPLGLDAGPGVSAWYQYFHRDPPNGAGQAGSALSDALELCFTF